MGECDSSTGVKGLTTKKTRWLGLCHGLGVTLWFCAYFFAGIGLLKLIPSVGAASLIFDENREIDRLRGAAILVKHLEDMLGSGVVPSESDWRKIDSFPSPWGQVLNSSLKDLRDQGAPVIPTLSRMRKTLQDEVEALLESRMKSAQARAQAWLSLALIPLFAVALYLTLPGVRESGVPFLFVVMISFLLSSFSFLWILSLSDQARFGNVRRAHRSWFVMIQASMERILALISSGRPPDLAWRMALSELYQSDPSLAKLWGAQIWDPIEDMEFKSVSECERLMVGLGVELRRSIQTSLIDGRGCLDRLESIHRACSLELRSKVQHELSLLPNRCLAPLFIFAFPSVILLLTGSLWFSFQEVIS
jgi:hypothetical protein